MAAALIYARISKDAAGESLGVKRQQQLCRELAKQKGLDIGDVIIDNDVSAYHRKPRPGFERLVDMLKNGEADAVVVYHADRLYRRLTDLERIVDVVEVTGAQVFTVAAGSVDLSTASGRMVARMLGAAAQHESERTGERSMAMHDELAAAGKHPGGRPPYGYSRGYVINRDEAKGVRFMARRVLEGASLLAIARELDAKGVPTREGRSWHHSSVRATLVNPAIAGLRVHRREVAGPGNWTPVLDRATWEQVRAVLADPARKRTRPARKYLLTGIVENVSGDKLVGGPDIRYDQTRDRRKPSGEERRVYRTLHPASPSVQIDADELEAYVVEMVLGVLDEAAVPVAESDPEAGGEVATIEAELAELADLRGRGTISLSEWMAAREPLQARLAAAKDAAGRARRPTRTERRLSEPGAVSRDWKAGHLDFPARREVLTAVLERVVIGPSPRGRWTPVDQRIASVDWRI